MGQYGAPRDSLSRPFEGYPAYGAVHDVLPSASMRDFMLRFSVISDQVFKEAETSNNLIIDNTLPEDVTLDEADKTDDYSDYDPRTYYKIFDPETIGVSVVEMDPAARHARAVRAVWENQDFGAVEQEARNEINRKFADRPMQLKFTSAMGVGKKLPGVPRTEVRQKLALMPSPTEHIETLETIDGEAGKIIDAIRSRLKQFIYPWDIVPHLTFSVFKSTATPEQVNDIVGKTNKHLAKKPVTLTLGGLDFRNKSERKRR